jgi:hypothetical protein
MLNLIRHSTHRLRFWLLAAAAILLITSVIEASHVHGIFSQADDNCILCQHTVALDKVLVGAALINECLLFSVLAFTVLNHFTPRLKQHFALIRAPPVISYC